MPQLFLAIGVLAVSTAPLLIRLAQPAPPLTIAASRVLLAAVLIGLVAWRQYAEIIRLKKRELGLLLVAGLALAAHFAFWITSLSMTSTTASVALVATQPIFAGLLGYKLLGEGFQRQEIIGIVIAGIGSLILAGGDLGGSSTDALIGDALAVAGAVTVPVYLLVGRALRHKVPLLAYLSCVNLIAGLALLAGGGVIGMSWRGFGQEEYIALVLLGVVPSVLGHTLLNYCVRLVPVHLVSLGILVEPVAATMSTWVVFAEVPSVHAGVGGCIVVAGIYAGFGYRAK